MRVVLALPGLQGLDPAQTCRSVADAWVRRAPHVRAERFPQSDGPGLVAAVAAAPGHQARVSVVDGRPVAVAVAPDGTVHVEAAEVLGPAVGSSYPLGRVLRALREDGATRLVVATGGARCDDAGLGLLRAVAGLRDEGYDDGLEWVGTVRDRWAEVSVTAAVEDLPPLLGFHGAAASGGSDGAQAQRAEDRTGRYVDRLRPLLPVTRELLTGGERRLDRTPGAGAGGGLAYGLLVLGGGVRVAADLVAERSGLQQALSGAEVVVTGAPVLDWRSLEHSVVSRVATAAAEAAVPTVALCREQHVGRREAMSLGLAGTYSLLAPGRPGPPAEEPPADLAGLVRRVAATWTPTRPDDVR